MPGQTGGMATVMAGTAGAICERLSARDFAGGAVHAQGGHALTLWLGECCEMCDPGVKLTFRGVSMTAGLAEARTFDRPSFRLATDDEQNERELFAAHDEAAYCVESRALVDAPRLFVVARAIEVDPPEA